MRKCKECAYYPACKMMFEAATCHSVNENATQCEMFKDAENVAEVVRCKDCKYASNFEVLGDLCECRFYRDMRKKTDFCNYGERRKA